MTSPVSDPATPIGTTVAASEDPTWSARSAMPPSDDVNCIRPRCANNSGVFSVRSRTRSSPATVPGAFSVVSPFWSTEAARKLPTPESGGVSPNRASRDTNPTGKTGASLSGFGRYSDCRWHQNGWSGSSRRSRYTAATGMVLTGASGGRPPFGDQPPWIATWSPACSPRAFANWLDTQIPWPLPPSTTCRCAAKSSWATSHIADCSGFGEPGRTGLTLAELKSVEATPDSRGTSRAASRATASRASSSAFPVGPVAPG
ncbi:hypothetical protein [Amycolatopsis sp. M39]|uniref:hypothetical protein n=1 Tax=Amycolatopsis sp. M39 TaxID=1825094 RepID=UPI0007DEB5A9|nr:hypothetical protein [Amycolatopsis sp. M39]OAP25290.1 hypothetical protein A4R44_03673 [Amycolatopsis sp. M39]